MNGVGRENCVPLLDFMEARKEGYRNEDDDCFLAVTDFDLKYALSAHPICMLNKSRRGGLGAMLLVARGLIERCCFETYLARADEL